MNTTSRNKTYDIVYIAVFAVLMAGMMIMQIFEENMAQLIIKT